MIGSLTAHKGGRALAGLALFVSVCACSGSDDSSGPDAPTEGETAALLDAEAMLEERQPEPEATPDAAPEEDSNE